jgi:hypothetical protein
MNVTQLIKKSQLMLVAHAPAALTGVGVVGVVATAYLTGKSTVKAVRVLDEYKTDLTDHKLVVKNTWPLYITPAIVGATSIAAIVGANYINTKRAAVLMALLLSNKERFEEYRNKAHSVFGEKKVSEMENNLAQDRMDANPIQQTVVVSGNNGVLMYDDFTGRYFESTMENLSQAVNEINYQINNNWCASLNDFYEFVGLDTVGIGDFVGWNTNELLELEQNVTAISSDGRPCFVIRFRNLPMPKYENVN